MFRQARNCFLRAAFFSVEMRFQKYSLVISTDKVCDWNDSHTVTVIIGRTLAKFTHLKRNKRFDNFIMLVGVQGSLFHIAAGSHPDGTESVGSQDSLYRGQIQKLLQCCQKPYQQIPLIITIQKKYSLTYLRRTVS